MKLYIPEIGDSIKLEEDWSFLPVKESRNSKLFEFFLPKEFINNMVGRVNNTTYYYEGQGYNRRGTKRKINEDYDESFLIKNSEKDSLPKELKKHFYFNIFSNENKEIIGDFEVTIPKDSILKIDRVYIRKGASDYSSVTFYIEHIPGVKLKGKVRFFANLSDVNNIEISVNRLNFLKIGKSKSLTKLIESLKYHSNIDDIKYNIFLHYNYSDGSKLFLKNIPVTFEKKEVLTLSPIANIETIVKKIKYLDNEKEIDIVKDWSIDVVEDGYTIFNSKSEKELTDFITNFVIQKYIKK